MRLFFALWPEDTVRAALAAAADGFVLRDGRAEPIARLHMTLRFLGDVAEAQRQRWCDAAAAIVMPAFALQIDQAGWWPGSTVAWLAPRDTPPGLTALVTALARVDLPTTQAPWSFRAHVTAARRVRRAPGLARPFAVTWPVSAFALLASVSDRAGTRYEVLQQWPLAPAAQR